MMNLQYISDSTGQTTGVFIPIVEWNELKKRLKDLDLEDILIPAWQVKEVRQRLADFRSNPDQGLDFDAAMEEIEKEN
jgi:hypothetical protein